MVVKQKRNLRQRSKACQTTDTLFLESLAEEVTRIIKSSKIFSRGRLSRVKKEMNPEFVKDCFSPDFTVV
jgi:hypothetical protein